jgi:two-component system NtrC family sensor kinase
LELQGIELETELARELPLLSCDAGQIQQVILALLLNAIEAMPRGGRLGVTTEAAPGREVLLRVRDNGMGIPAEVLPHIFEPFFSTKEDQHRTGLGLAVAQSIVEQHGGEVRVHSTPGAGTEFVVCLPFETPAEFSSLEDVHAQEKGEHR